MLLALAAAAAAPASALTPDGWGTLRIGMRRADVVRALGGGSGAAGGPSPERCEEFHPRRAPAGMIVLIENGRLARIAATRPGLATAAGIAVGDPAAKVRRLHGERLRRVAHTYVDPPAADWTWWRDKRRGIHYEIGADGRVASIRVGGPAIRYVEGCL